jgi:hypothetical protein
MGHFAKIENNIVTNVIVAEDEFIQSGVLGEPSSWIKTSYNTREGIHLQGGEPLRKNFAGIGYSYNKDLDAFIPPKPLEYESWILNEEKCIWEPPIKMPSDGKSYYWDEELLEWVLLDESSIFF